jgi:hypothetical protein
MACRRAGGIFGPVLTYDFRVKNRQQFLRGREISGEKIREFLPKDFGEVFVFTVQGPHGDHL